VDHRITGDAHQDNLVADSPTTQALVQGANHNSNCNQAVGQDALQDQPLAEAKASAEAIKADPSMDTDTQMGVEDLNQ